jgi:hypothetical protein
MEMRPLSSSSLTTIFGNMAALNVEGAEKGSNLLNVSIRQVVSREVATLVMPRQVDQIGSPFNPFSGLSQSSLPVRSNIP